MKAWIGADVGKKGAIVIIFEQPDFNNHYGVKAHEMPTIGKGKGAEYDIPKMVELFTHYKSCYDLTVLIEDVHSIFGSSAGSNFTFGVGSGLLRGVVGALQIPFTLVSPKTWQAFVYEGVAIIEKAGTKAKGKSAYDRKAMSLVAVKRLYPKFSLLRTPKCSTPDEGIVDALLMAHYAKHKL